ncbi:unnamed protein product [Clonostachys byssicola]|uniref:Uncharacterized protein n=1 Tax=Clonostachys byssicola TaxID=160290 RepID=A0A9N9UM70_9HYPO|nr:unnamed protein product [Clonostachys byssicola]
MALTTRNRVEASLTGEGPLAASVGRPEVGPQLAVAAADSTTTTCRLVLKLLPGNVMTKLLRTSCRLDSGFEMEMQMDLMEKMVEESEERTKKMVEERIMKLIGESEESMLLFLKQRIIPELIESLTGIFKEMIQESEDRTMARVQGNQMDIFEGTMQHSKDRMMPQVGENQTGIFKRMIQESEDRTMMQARRAQMDLHKRMMKESEGQVMARVRALLARWGLTPRDQQGMIQEGSDRSRHHGNNRAFGSMSSDGHSRNALRDQHAMMQQDSDHCRNNSSNEGLELIPSDVSSRNAFRLTRQDTSRQMNPQFSISALEDKLQNQSITDTAREEPQFPGYRTNFKIAVDILSAKPPVGSYQLAQITRPWFPAELTREKQAQYDSDREIVSAMIALTRSMDDMGDMMTESTLNLWNIAILVYQETPYWLLSAHHGFSCKNVNDQVEMGEITHEALWPLEFVHQLADIIVHPLFACRPNGAFFRLALQFAIACRYPFACAWDISNLVTASGIECPLIAALQEDMLGAVAKSTDNDGFHRFVMYSGITVYQRLGIIHEVFESDEPDFSPSQEAKLLLELGRLIPEVPGPKAIEDLKRESLGDKRCVFFVNKGDLDKIQQALDNVAPDQSTSGQVTTIKTSVHSEFRAISRETLKGQMEDAYRHEMYLRKAFNDRTALLNTDILI